MVDPRPNPPCESVARATKEMRGKRSGVEAKRTTRAYSQTVKPTEDINDIWHNSRSPEPDKAAGETTTRGLKEHNKKKTRPQRKPRTSLPGAENNMQNNTVVQPSKLIRRVALGKGRNFHASPADLSVVSTAPPTPAVGNSDSPLVAAPKESPFVTQDHEETTAEVATARQTQTEDQEAPTEKPADIAHTPSPELPVGGGGHEENEEDDDDDDDELVPPPPPVTHDESQDVDDGFPAAFDDDDDNDDDDKEGEGFQLSDHLGHSEESQDDIGLPSEIESQEHELEPSSNKEKPTSDGNEEEEHQLAQGAKATGTTTPKSTVSGTVMETPKQSGDEEITNAYDNNGEDDDDDDMEEDKDGEGFNMIHDPETPESVREERALQEQDKMEKDRKKKGKKKKKARFSDEGQDQVDGDETEDETPAKSVKSRKRAKKVRIGDSPLGYPAGPRDYKYVPVSDYKETPEEGVRRSGRARCKPLEYWKNERPVFGPHDDDDDDSLGETVIEAMGNMPVVKQYCRAEPTPYKKRKIAATSKKGSTAKGKASSSSGQYDDPAEIPFDAKRLKKKYDYIEGEKAGMWNEGAQTTVDQKVVSYSRNLARHDLPLGSDRKKSEGKIVGRAAQAFNIQEDEHNENYVGYIMGHLALPPKGIKDAESVGVCAQTFTVCHCQPNSLEIAYADPEDGEGAWDPSTAQRFLLTPGDMFRVPQGNSYRLQNHSTTTECLLTWTIIKPHVPRA